MRLAPHGISLGEHLNIWTSKYLNKSKSMQWAHVSQDKFINFYLGWPNQIYLNKHGLITLTCFCSNVCLNVQMFACVAPAFVSKKCFCFSLRKLNFVIFTLLQTWHRKKSFNYTQCFNRNGWKLNMVNSSNKNVWFSDKMSKIYSKNELNLK